tara:strand:- start:123 stop:317 length:195 start_codon:yes stop_codon:yes gene_type:complete
MRIPGGVNLKLMLQGYSKTRPIKVGGKHTGENVPRIPPDGCRHIEEPAYAVCARGVMWLWFVIE